MIGVGGVGEREQGALGMKRSSVWLEHCMLRQMYLDLGSQKKKMTRAPSSAKYCAQSNLILCFEGPQAHIKKKKKKSSKCQVSPYFSSLVCWKPLYDIFKISAYI